MIASDCADRDGWSQFLCGSCRPHLCDAPAALLGRSQDRITHKTHQILAKHAKILSNTAALDVFLDFLLPFLVLAVDCIFVTVIEN